MCVINIIRKRKKTSFYVILYIMLTITTTYTAVMVQNGLRDVRTIPRFPFRVCFFIPFNTSHQLPRTQPPRVVLNAPVRDFFSDIASSSVGRLFSLHEKSSILYARDFFFFTMDEAPVPISATVTLSSLVHPFSIILVVFYFFKF